MKITLTQTDIYMASHIGVLRQVASLNRQDNHGFNGIGWSEHIEGALGELVASYALRIPWHPRTNTFKSFPDIGTRNLQVRTRSRLEYDLIIRPDDSDDDIFILVIGKCPHYEVVGWILGRDAKHERYWKDIGNLRPPAWFVPREVLEQIEKIGNIVKLEKDL